MGSAARQITPCGDHGGLRPGARIDGRYIVLRHLGGGVSDVYEALDQRTGACVALKRACPAPRNQRLPRRDLLALLRQEACVLRDLRHPRVPRLVEARLDGSSPYLAQSYVPGETIEQLLLRGFPEPATAIRVAAELCWIVGSLHRLPSPVLHLDLKPANVIIGRWGEVHLIDFGLARYQDAQDAPLLPMGTPPYAPAEQAVGHRLDGRADLHALGHLIWDMIDERSASPALARALDRASAALPWQRYPSVRAFHRALLRTPEAELARHGRGA